MARKNPTTWITGKQAAKILSDNNGHAISDRYVRRLAATGKIETQEITNRMNLYSKEDTEKCVVADRPGRKGDARAAGSRRKSAKVSEQAKEEAIA